MLTKQEEKRWSKTWTLESLALYFPEVALNLNILLLPEQVFLSHQRAPQWRRDHPRPIPGPAAQHGQADLPRRDGLRGGAPLHQDDDIRLGGHALPQGDVPACQGSIGNIRQ